MEKGKLKGYCYVAAFTVVFYLGLNNIDRLQNLFSVLLGLITPFIVGLVIAFILNGPMDLLERKIFCKMHRKKLVRPLALICVYIVLILAVIILPSFVLPQLINSVTQLTNSIPGFLVSTQEFLTSLAASLELSPEMWAEFSTAMQGLVENLLSLIPKLFGMLPRVYSVIASVGGGVFNLLIGVILSIYLLLGKEKLLSQMSRLNRAFLPERASMWISHAGDITVSTFRNYISGQLLDALIVGIVSVVGLSIFRFPYALLIGVLMGCTNIIPFFGPFIGFLPGFLIIVIINPVQALWFSVFVLVIQQVDGNVIVPRVVGQSVGLPPLWVLFSVIVGGNLFGIAGMILGMPVFAIIYQILGEATRKRENSRPSAA